jgi:hypothetical protein
MTPVSRVIFAKSLGLKYYPARESHTLPSETVKNPGAVIFCEVRQLLHAAVKDLNAHRKELVQH